MNNIVDHIYVINMKKDKIRLNNFKKQVDKLFNYEIWEGVDITNKKYTNIYQSWLNQRYKVSYNNFNWKFYLNNYPDLLNAGLKTKIQAWTHWNNFGKKELRCCNPNQQIVNKAQLGCLLSHLQIIIDAYNKKYRNILILEDDIIITDIYDKKINQIKNLISHPFNILYLGASQHSWKNINIDNVIYKAKNTTGAFAYIVDQKFYKTLIEHLKFLNKPVDVYYSDLQKKYTMKVFYPNLIISNLNISNIGQKRNNESWFKKFRWSIDFKSDSIINSSCTDIEDNKKILVVLPTLNRSQNIQHIIDMFLNQRYEYFTLLIINDGSDQDHYLQLVKLEEKYKTNPQIMFKHNSKNLKVASCLNKGIVYFLENNYDYFTWVSDDNKYNSVFLDSLIKLGGDFNYSNFLFLDNITNIKSYHNYSYKDVYDLIKNYRGCASFMWSKDAIKLIGLYSEDLEGCEDYEYLLRTFHNINNIKYSQECLMIYTRDETSGFFKKSKRLLEIKNIINKNYIQQNKIHNVLYS
jgi:GR25 family glycosyltransferase involved in LPS biosynthesis